MRASERGSVKSGSSGREIVGLRGIELRREERLVLKDIELSIRAGEHWVLLGPNGSGKSSLLAMLQGFLWPQEGEVRVLGNVFGDSDITGMRRVIGWVGNDIEPEFPAWQTVEEIAWSGCVGTVGLRFDAPSGTEKARARKLLRAAGIGHLAKRRFTHLSQGQRRMSTIVRALMVKPGLLILDEPAAGLDPVAREGFLERLSALMRDPAGPAILYVTHHVEEILPEFTHVLMLRQGKAVDFGTIRECLTEANLEKVFGRAVALKKREGRYSLRLRQFGASDGRTVGSRERKP